MLSAHRSTYLSYEVPELASVHPSMEAMACRLPSEALTCDSSQKSLYRRHDKKPLIEHRDLSLVLPTDKEDILTQASKRHARNSISSKPRALTAHHSPPLQHLALSHARSLAGPVSVPHLSYRRLARSLRQGRRISGAHLLRRFF